LDPKHRPQKWTAPATTVRRDWRKFPQEAHVLDLAERRYRRFSADEIAILQGFDPTVVDLPNLTERQRVAALGDAVPPPLATALVRGITREWNWRNHTTVEICAGIGGLAEGAASASLEHLLLLDASDTCAELLRNRRPWSANRVVQADIRQFDFSPYCKRVGLLSGGPPCQPWSQSGRHEGEDDRRDLLSIMPELVAAIEPEVFLFENVPGLAMFADGQYLDNLVRRLRHPAHGSEYGVLAATLNAADFGVPQVRRRVFILGVRGRPAALASRCFDRVAQVASHRDPSSAADGRPPWRTVADALEGHKDPGGWRRWIGSGLG
jgi:site-specific DNA-cytosine methylase